MTQKMDSNRTEWTESNRIGSNRLKSDWIEWIRFRTIALKLTRKNGFESDRMDWNWIESDRMDWIGIFFLIWNCQCLEAYVKFARALKQIWTRTILDPDNHAWNLTRKTGLKFGLKMVRKDLKFEFNRLELLQSDGGRTWDALGA